LNRETTYQIWGPEMHMQNKLAADWRVYCFQD